MPKLNVLALAASLAMALVWFVPGPDALAEVRRQTPPQAFSSGAMRSERVLTEIRDVLVRIDGRLAGIERQVAGLRTLAASRRDAKPAGAAHVR